MKITPVIGNIIVIETSDGSFYEITDNIIDDMSGITITRMIFNKKKHYDKTIEVFDNSGYFINKIGEGDRLVLKKIKTEVEE